MKKYLLFLIPIILIASAFLYIKFKGALPAILPPQITQNTQQLEAKNQQQMANNDLGLNIPPGFSIDFFAKGLDAPRDLVFDNNGTLLASIPAKGKVVALPDKDDDGKTDKTVDVLTGLNRPHGIAFFDNKLFVAQENRLARYNWDPQNLQASLDKPLFTLPKGGRHFTRTIAFKNNGTMYVSIGSSCDVCKETDPFLASVIKSDSNGTNPQVFVKGLRNAVFITVNESSQKLWGTEMGRDNLGDNLPPDEINVLEDGKDYGWPNCYGSKIADTKFNPGATDQNCQNTQSPLYALCAHCAPLGLAFIKSDKFPNNWQGDLLVSLHGSWNSTKPVGYKIIKLHVEDGKITSEEDFISNFLQGNQTKGRPVDLAFSPNGDLFISDDKAGVIYRVFKP